MIPVLDSVKARRTPFVNVAFIAINLAVFIYELTLNAADLNAFFLDYGIIPAQLDAWASDPDGFEESLTVVSATFIHGGWLHLAGNMLFLWVFGDNIEDALGHIGYFVFYFVCAVGAAAAEVAFDTSSLLPVVGASGAVAGVLGAYLVLYPRGIITVLVPFFFFIPFPLPAFVIIVFWFLMQLASGVASIGTTEVSEGIAFWAHVGGFVTGFVILLVLRRFVKRRPYTQARRGGRTQMW
ncbi:MAG TPA: rhomboid family intramembrane serine protease [Dehalococcoidia bacterium]|nr:rhomboid family intramembrane serine protease [Dehalococcoidia bacterium]